MATGNCTQCQQNNTQAAQAEATFEALDASGDWEAADAAFQKMRRDLPAKWWDCDCGAHVEFWRPERPTGLDTVTCPRCHAEFNSSGQQLRSDWAGNPSCWDDEVGDLEGFELQQVAAERY